MKISKSTIFNAGCACVAMLTAASNYTGLWGYDKKANIQSTADFVVQDKFHCVPKNGEGAVKSILKGADSISLSCADNVRELSLNPKNGIVKTKIIKTGQTIQDAIPRKVNPFGLLTQDIRQFAASSLETAARIIRKV